MSGPQIYIEDPVEREIYRTSTDYLDADARTRALRVKPEDIERYLVVRNFLKVAQNNISEGIFSLLREHIPLWKRYTVHMLGEDSEDNHSDVMDRLWRICYEFETDKEMVRLYFEYPCRLHWEGRKDIVKWFQGEGKSQIDKAAARLGKEFPDKWPEDLNAQTLVHKYGALEMVEKKGE